MYKSESLSLLQAPLDDRRRLLERRKNAFQFGRDVDDEKIWIAERINAARAKVRREKEEGRRGNGGGW